MNDAKLSWKVKKYIAASIIGNGLEWYDFIIFGYFSPIFAAQFFPAESSFASLINIFIVFAVGFLSRPLGAYLFGKIADIHGRKNALLLSVFMMGLSTTLMGILPTYEHIGIIAPLFLTFLRITQGISLGGEFTSSLTFIVEHSSQSKRGLVGAWVYAGGFFGSALATATAALTTLLTSTEQLHAWGWRLPFIFGFVIAFLGYILRKHMEETPQFLELKKMQTVERHPFSTIVKNNLFEVFTVIGILLPNTVWIYLVFVFLPNYLTQIKHWNFGLSMLINFIPAILMMILLPFFGHLSDIWGRKKVMLLGMVLSTVIAPLAFQAISQAEWYHVLLLQVLISITLSLSYAPTAALMVELFPTRLRSSGMALSYHIATGIFGGMTPLVIASLITMTGGVYVPMLLVMTTGVIGIISLAQVNEKYELSPLRQ